ncbi:MAG TPA: DNA damage-inducible protein D [Ktedonobacteraceae bacterium]|nr:DNA damage-inducible protein D [Ktedonobacteraceae bacterium]
MNISPDFDSIKQTNMYAEEYWSARDLMPLLGYGQKWQNFSQALEKAITACRGNEIAIENHFTDASKMVSLGSGSQRKLKDYYLSRFACYLIAQNGDPRKPEIAAAQVYFAISTRENELQRLLREQQERLATRLKVSESYKTLGEAASLAGVDSAFFGIFIDAGYLGLHRHTREELMQIKDIPDGEDYLDNITRSELSAIDFKNVQTEEKLLRENIYGNEEAAQAHYFIGDQVRKAIEAMHAPYPEDLPSAPSIRKMVEERQRKVQKRKRLNPPPDPQNTLF